MSTTPSTNPARPADALASGLRRTEVQHRTSSIPGRDIVQVRTEIPDGVASGWHTHPGEEIGYIVEGTVRMEVAGEEALLLPAGTGFLIPPGTPHNAHDLGPGTGVMLSTYLVDPQAPLSTFVDAPTDAEGDGG
jgi:quercetin dioxygenase-like cupin family protein